MKIKFSMMARLLFCFSLLIAQGHPFETFAIKQDRLFLKAYEQKNIPAYRKLLDEFTIRYIRLD